MLLLLCCYCETKGQRDKGTKSSSEAKGEGKAVRQRLNLLFRTWKSYVTVGVVTMALVAMIEDAPPDMVMIAATVPTKPTVSASQPLVHD